jgi:hypothetical protein
MLEYEYIVPVFDIQNKSVTLRYSASARQTGDICLDINHRLVFLDKHCVK